MCDSCFEYEFVCRKCGTILDPEFTDKQVYLAERKQLKPLADTAPDGDAGNWFVWFLRYHGTIVKVGWGSLQKLCNEMKPNSSYCKFDTVFIYYCDSEAERNVFATVAMGRIEGVVNRKAVPNMRFVGRAGVQFKNTVPPYIRSVVLSEPDLVIGEAQYWDLTKLQEASYV